MHPALRQHVGPPTIRTGRWIAVGLLTGFAGVALAMAITRVVETRRANAYQDRIERRAALTDEERSQRLSVHTLARQLELRGFAGWVAAHPDTPCPAQITDLEPYAGAGTTVDPWGMRFRFRCDGVHFRVISSGPDRIAGTGDDIGGVR